MVFEKLVGDRVFTTGTYDVAKGVCFYLKTNAIKLS